MASSTSDLARPLSETELDELEAFLGSAAVSDECMDIETLDGFLTGLVVGPETIMPSEWLPRVWSVDGDEAKAPAFETRDQAQRILDLMLRHMNGIVARLATPGTYEPLLYEESEDADGLSLGFNWSHGFITAMELRHEAWDALGDGEDTADALLPIIALTAPADDPDYGDVARDRASRAAYAGDLAASVATIDAFWKAARNRPVTQRRPTPKVGANAPCPCGSGKKYKRCCGAH